MRLLAHAPDCASRGATATSGFRRTSPRLSGMVSSSQAGGRVLVTGGAGFIGTTLALSARGPRRALGRPRQPAPAGAPGLAAAGGTAGLGRAPCRRRHPRRGPGRGRRRPAPRHRDPPGRRDRHRAVAVGEHPPRHGQRRRHHPAARLPHPRRSRAGTLRADQLAGGLRRGRVAKPRRVHVPAGAAHARAAGGGSLGPRHRRGPRAQLGRRHAPQPDQRLRRDQAGPGADPVGLDRLARHEAVGAAPAERLRPAPVAVQPLHRHRVAVLPPGPRGPVDPALRGRRHHPRLRLHRRRGQRAGRRHRKPAGGPHAHRRRRQRRTHHHRRPGPRDRGLPLGARAARDRPVPRRRRPPRLLHRRRHHRDTSTGRPPGACATASPDCRSGSRRSSTETAAGRRARPP